MPPDGTPRAASAFARADEIVIPGIAADGSLYPIEKIAAHRAGALHLAVSVFVFSGDRLLVQRRAAGKYHCAGLWANTCCTHPHWDEPPALSAARRLHEELGLALTLTHTGIIDYEADVSGDMRECERVHVYRGVADARRLAVTPDPAEVSETRWATVDELRVDALARPEAYAPWFRIYLERWSELGL
ncbi:MAG: NUDIX domain-containing protein [Hyphomonadaceae bacterium]|nr:NUDIX domain-containing protein [Hyphomonadaceae bacterium]